MMAGSVPVEINADWVIVIDLKRCFDSIYNKLNDDSFSDRPGDVCVIFCCWYFVSQLDGASADFNLGRNVAGGQRPVLFV